MKSRRHWPLVLALAGAMAPAAAFGEEAQDPVAVSEAAAVAHAKAVEAAADRQYKVPRTAYGQPELEGVWTNVSITPFERPAQFAGSVELTAAQAAQLEIAAIEHYIEGNAPTDPNAPATDTTRKHCQGPGGLDCGYNSAWKDSATTVARIDGRPHSSFITSTPNGRIPGYKAGYQSAGLRAARDDGEGSGLSRGPADNPEDRPLGERCLTSFGYSAGPIMLPLLYNNNYTFAQSQDSVAILVEMVHDVRMIRIGAKHRTDGLRPWFGDSIGRYEGDTLVVETSNFPRSQAFRGAWKELKVTERFTRKGPHRMLYQFTAEDPTVWEQPWGGEYEFTSSQGRVYEYACQEGNYALAGVLAGARAEEAAAANRPDAARAGGAVAAAASAAKIDLNAFDALKKTIALPNGEILAYVEMGNPAGRPVVLVHGYTDSARDWVPMLPYVAKQFRLILIDIRGHGQSSKPECCYNRLDFAYDIKLLLDALQLSKADFVGHSLGTIIIQTFAEYWPERTGRIVLISSTGGMPPDAPKKSPQFDFASAIRNLKEPIEADSPFMIAWWDSPTPVDPDFIARERKDAAAIPLRVWLAVLDQTLAGDNYADLQRTLPLLKAPTLLIWGSKDPIMEEPMRKSLMQALPNAQVKIFDGLGHNPFWENPAAVAQAVNAFLAP